MSPQISCIFKFSGLTVILVNITKVFLIITLVVATAGPQSVLLLKSLGFPAALPRSVSSCTSSRWTRHSSRPTPTPVKVGQLIILPLNVTLNRFFLILVTPSKRGACLA